MRNRPWRTRFELFPLKSAVAASVARMAWLHAEAHPAGAGLACGADLRVMRGQLRYQDKENMHFNNAACLAIASGRQWTQA